MTHLMELNEKSQFGDRKYDQDKSEDNSMRLRTDANAVNRAHFGKLQESRGALTLLAELEQMFDINIRAKQALKEQNFDF